MGFRGALTIDIVVYATWYECCASTRRKMETHREKPSQGIIGLRCPMNSTPLGEWGNDVPNLEKSDSGSSYRLSIPLTGGSVPQTDAAALTQHKTPFTGGRSVRSVCQQSSSSFQTSSERPSSSAFAGLKGLSPSKTFDTTSDTGSPPKGGDPVSTCTENTISVHVRNRAVRTW